MAGVQEDLDVDADLPGLVPHASWARRAAATVLDGAVLAGATWLVLGSEGVAPSLWPGLSSDGAPAGPSWVSSPWLVAVVVAYVLLQGLTGQTPGKRVVGVVVVDGATGRPAGVLRSLARPVVHLLDGLLLVGYLRPLWDTRGRTFADQVLRTLVVPVGPGQEGAHPRHLRSGVLVTAGAVVVCLAGLGLSVPASAGGSARVLQVPCAPVQDGARDAHDPLTSSAEVTRDVSWTRERRLLWTRGTVDEPGPLTVRWQPVGSTPTGRLTVVGTVGPVGTVDGRQQVDVAPVPGGEVLVELPVAPELEGGAVVVTSQVLVDGESVAACSVTVGLAGTQTAPDEVTDGLPGW